MSITTVSLKVLLIAALASSAGSIDASNLRVNLQVSREAALALSAIIDASTSRVEIRYPQYIEKKFSDLLGANLEYYGSARHPFVCLYELDRPEIPTQCSLYVHPNLRLPEAILGASVSVETTPRGRTEFLFTENFESSILQGHLKLLLGDQSIRQLNDQFVLSFNQTSSESSNSCENGTNFTTTRNWLVKRTDQRSDDHAAIRCSELTIRSICHDTQKVTTFLPHCKLRD